MLFSFLVTSCVPQANGFADFYFDASNGYHLQNSDEFISVENPAYYISDDLQADYLNMLENGYYLIGQSSFEGIVKDTQKFALEQAENVGASVVIVSGKFAKTVTTSTPITTPIVETSKTTGNATVKNAYGLPLGSVTGSARTTTTKGYNTNYITNSVDRFLQEATYWIQFKDKPKFGVQVRDLTEEERSLIGSNKGLVLLVVVKGTPAFNADFFRGDIIKRFAGIEITGSEVFSEAIGSNLGKEVEVEIIRDGETLTKKVTLNN